MNKFSKDYKQEMNDVRPSNEFRSRLITSIEKEQKKKKFSLVRSTGFKVGVAGLVTASLGAGIIYAATSVGKNSNGNVPNSTVVNHQIKTYGAQISVEDIKKSYKVNDSDAIMPLYNVDQTESFTFDFKFDAYEERIDLYDYVTVHTDYECQPESAIYYNASLEVDDGKTTLTVAPMEPIMKTDSQAIDYVYNDIDTWGNAPMYYLAIHYDMESETVKKLDEPTVIPFTVKNKVSAPNVKGVVDEKGRFKLVWDAVEGAEKYNIYKLTDDKLSTGKDNHDISGAKVGYKDLTLLYDGETTDTYFNNFSGADHGMARIEDMMIEYKVGSNDDLNDEGIPVFTYGQNYAVNGEYYVTAVVNGVESGLSSVVETSNLILPHVIEDENDIENREYESAKDFPTEVEVLNIDGSSTKHAIHYNRVEGINYLGYYTIQYNYTVEGTALTGHIYPLDELTAPNFVGVPKRENGLVKPEDNVDKTPDNGVETIIDPGVATAGDAVAEEEAEGLVNKQIVNTKKHIQLGNKKTVENVAEGIYVIADSAEEEWLALNMIQANKKISVEGFTKLQDPYVLVDTLDKVCAQNPFILGVASYSYDYETFTVKIEYNLSKDEIVDMQKKLVEKSNDILGKITNDNMSDEDKVVAIYEYLRENVKYNTEAAEAAANNDYNKDELKKFENNFNAYGALIEGTGICSSYAYAFKMLCDLSEIQCIVVTGSVKDTASHAWNEIVIDETSFEIDCSSEIDLGSKPYTVSFEENELTKDLNYTRDDYYKLND